MAVVAGTLGEVLAGPLAPPPSAGVAALRAELDAVARAATATGGWTADGPLRLSKHLVTGLLRCPRRALAEIEGAPGAAVGGSGDDIVVGWIVDAAAKLAVVSPRRRVDVHAAVAFLTALGDTTVADRLADLGAGADRLVAEAGARIDRLAATWPAIDAAWWPRVEEPVRAPLADGAVTVAGRLDVLLGGPPTGRPAVVVEVKGGRWYDGMRADGHLYALMVALRDGEVPAAAVTVVSDGTTQVEPIRPALLQHAAERLDEAMGIAARVAAGEPPPPAPGVHCQHCPVRADCPAAGGPVRVDEPVWADEPVRAEHPAAGGPVRAEHPVGADEPVWVEHPAAGGRARPTGSNPAPAPASRGNELHPDQPEVGVGSEPHDLALAPVEPVASGSARPPEPGRLLADPVGTAGRLRATLAGRIAGALAGALAGASAPVGDVYVGWVAARDAAGCPARYRLDGEHGWGFPGWSPPLAAGACARAALAHHLARTDPGGAGHGGPLAAPAPLDAIRAWMRALRQPAELPVERSGVGDWVRETWEAGDTAVLAAVAATAARWLAGFVRVLGWPLPPQLTLLGAPRPAAAPAPSWRPDKRSPVLVASGADARLGRVTGAGGFGLVVHRATTGDDGALRDRAAFEAAAGALAIGVAPAHVLVTGGDTGERVTVPVDGDLLARGAERIAGVVAQRAVAVGRGFDAADARPSPGCRHCGHRPQCPPGESWMRGPGRWRGGLPARPAG